MCHLESEHVSQRLKCDVYLIAPRYSDSRAHDQVPPCAFIRFASQVNLTTYFNITYALRVKQSKTAQW